MQRALALFKTLIFTVVVPGFVAGIVPRWLLKPGEHPDSGPSAMIGLLAIALGVIIYLRCAWDFAYTGLGTPSPIDPPKVLVSRGLHRFIRNPMYVGVLFVMLGQAALFHSLHILIYAACFLIIANTFVVLYEEPALHRQFGATYDDYRRVVPRWIPRFRHTSPPAQR